MLTIALKAIKARWRSVPRTAFGSTENVLKQKFPMADEIPPYALLLGPESEGTGHPAGRSRFWPVRSLFSHMSLAWQRYEQ